MFGNRFRGGFGAQKFVNLIERVPDSRSDEGQGGGAERGGVLPDIAPEQIHIERVGVDLTPERGIRPAADGDQALFGRGNLFERFLFISPMKFLNEYRLKRSIELLKSTDMTVTEIALACGFSGASYYAEAFRRETGKSPSQYRAEQT